MGYIRFDVDKIKDFVFESYKPVEVTGASEMIKLLDEDGELLREEFVKRFPDVELKVIYARGGGGLLQVDHQDEEVSQWLVELYEKEVKGGRLSAVYGEVPEDFPATLALLNYKLREEKNQKPLLTPPPRAIEFSLGEMERRCSACGKRKAIEKIETPDAEVLYYCQVCLDKRLRGTKLKDDNRPVNNLEDLLKSIPGIKDSTYLLMIYGDLNKAGDLFSSMEDQKQLGELSKKIFKTLEDTRKKMSDILWAMKFKSLMPVAGGDDLIIFIHPAAFGLIKETLFNLEAQLERDTGKKLKMNFSFLVAKHNFPIYHLFKTSEALLKETKKRYYREENSLNSFYGFKWLEDGSSRPSDEDVYHKEDFIALFDFAQKLHGNNDISTSALHQLLELLPVNKDKDNKSHIKPGEQFNISYHLARHSALKEMLSQDGSDYKIKKGEETPQNTGDQRDLWVTRDLWEDLIDMKELYSDTAIKKEAG